ncbi:tripartite motif-containing protein 10-like [Ornithorhynchus anatinus]|uniref:Tripartite motif containing 10 n=1 Tax=Ornithorhynchus anatinus TaxID=9258 RepID=A0A6I8N4K0_ORNAN|nr:tripartite motif-containing protein 10-like [Ornithorhynchus anatinus]
MAAASAVTALEEELSCPVCRGTLREPVTIDCGHNFCRACIARYRELAGPDIRAPAPLVCPLCKEPFQGDGFRPNWQLASVVENVERLKLADPGRAPGAEGPCPRHGEKLYFFCEDDEEHLCVLCREGPDHRTHTVRFLDEAAQPYREQIEKCLESLKSQREEIQGNIRREEQRVQVLLSQIETKRQKVLSEFEHLGNFLSGQRQLLLAQLEELGYELLTEQDGFSSRAAQELARFGALILELEEKCQLPPQELLKDIRSTLIRCETRKCRKSEAISPELGRRIRDFSQQALPVKREIKAFLGKLLLELDYDPARVVLDPETAHPKLLLGEDGRGARFSSKWQSSPASPGRFDRTTCVLARDGFTAGRHAWEVGVAPGPGGSCTVGLAGQDAPRKGELRLRPEEAVWAVRVACGFLSALSAFPARIPLRDTPRRLRVALDYDVGWLSFSDADTQETVYTFSASFTGRVFPFFGLWGRGSSLTLDP